MTQILVKGEAVYKCDVCNRSVRVPTNKTGIEIVQRCIITANCQGKLHRITIAKDINDTPAFPPEVVGVQDWFQRQILYTHTQTVQAATWVVQHNLGNKPNVYTFIQKYVDGILTLVETNPKQINIINLNQIEVMFDEAQSGLVQCITSSSQNSSNPNVTVGVITNLPDTQLTNQGELTIATLDTTSSTSIMMGYNSPTASTPINIEYLNVNAPSVLSPWDGVSHITLNGKKYTVRSFNILTTPTAPGYFTSGAVVSGSTAYFPTQELGQMLILLATAPYAAVDRMYSKYIDIATISQTTPQVYYNEGALYTNSSIIKNTYPPLAVV